MPSNSYGIGAGLGTLLGAFLRGQEEKKYEEELRRRLAEQQREVDAARFQTGQFTGPLPSRAEPPPTPPKAPPPTLLSALMGIPGTIGAGLTRGSPAISSLQDEYAQQQKEIDRQRSLAQALQMVRERGNVQLGNQKELAQFQQGLPLSVAQMQQQEFQRQQLQAQLQNSRSIAGMPQPLNAMQQLQYDYLTQNPDVLAAQMQQKARGSGKGVVVKQIGSQLAGIDKATGQPMWVIPNPTGQSIRERAVADLQAGIIWDNFTEAEQKKIAIGQIDPLMALFPEGFGAGGTGEKAKLPAYATGQALEQDMKEQLYNPRSRNRISPIKKNPRTGEWYYDPLE